MNPITVTAWPIQKINIHRIMSARRFPISSLSRRSNLFSAVSKILEVEFASILSNNSTKLFVAVSPSFSRRGLGIAITVIIISFLIKRITCHESCVKANRNGEQNETEYFGCASLDFQ